MRARPFPLRSPTLGDTALGAVALALTLAAAVRFWRPESTSVLVKLTAGAGMTLVGALPLAAVAWRLRRPVLSALATVLIAVGAQWLAVSLGSDSRHPAPPGAASLRIVTASLLAENTRLPELLAALRGSGADVLVLQEVTPEHAAVIGSSGILDAFPHAHLDPLPHYHGTAILSRLPMTEPTVFELAGMPMMRADIATATGVVRVVNVHVVAPLSDRRAGTWRRQLAGLASVPLAQARALLLAGDFNATLDHRSLAELADTANLRDAFAEAGRGLGATWPQWSGPLPPLLAIDHVLVSEPFTIVAASVQHNEGSDHRRLVVDLALPRAG